MTAQDFADLTTILHSGFVVLVFALGYHAGLQS